MAPRATRIAGSGREAAAGGKHAHHWHQMRVVATGSTNSCHSFLPGIARAYRSAFCLSVAVSATRPAPLHVRQKPEAGGLVHVLYQALGHGTKPPSPMDGAGVHSLCTGVQTRIVCPHVSTTFKNVSLKPLCTRSGWCWLSTHTSNLKTGGGQLEHGINGQQLEPHQKNSSGTPRSRSSSVSAALRSDSTTALKGSFQACDMKRLAGFTCAASPRATKSSA